MFSKKVSIFLLLSLLFVFLSSYRVPEEGMFPLSGLHNLDLRKAGLQIDQSEIYNPNGISITDALVNIGGCTGSFISDKGLIISNHHCTFSAVQKASSPEHDYITTGFVAPTLDQEIEAKGLTCRITESYEDVSEKMLAASAGIIDPLERIKALNTKSQEIIRAEEAKDKTIKAEVSEMFIGKRYVLFRYKIIRDVRLVYIPRISIGWFGGETDNWVWPRHTGDYAFVRAYVGPDGSSTPYSKNNVPYKPRKFLKINPAGVNQEDFIFSLGYPSSTFRNQPSQYLQYQEQYFLPYLAGLYEWQNQQMTLVGLNDKTLEIKQAERIKQNANSMKNYHGKLQGLARIEIIKQKQEEEKQMQQFIIADPSLKDKYGNMLSKISEVYKDFFADAKRFLWFQQIFKSTQLLAAAKVINDQQVKLNEVEKSKRNDYLKENKVKLKSQLEAIFYPYVEETDKRLLKKMMEDALDFPENERVGYIDNLFRGKHDRALREYVEKLFKKTQFQNEQVIYKLIEGTWEDIVKFKDPMLVLAEQLNNQLIIINQAAQKREGTLNKLIADYTDVKSAFKNTSFIPDANKTLRLTYGYVRGYQPADAVTYAPFTTLKGIIEKAMPKGDFEMPSIIKELYNKKDFGPFKHAKLNDVPVAFLYNLDTSSGTAGSPILNSKGEIVGVNFDRALTAAINDYAWNEEYSRSMGVDIRYVLWVAHKIDKADFILNELNIKTE